LRTWLQGVPVSLFGQDTMFGGAGQPLENADWPLWRTTRRAIGDAQAPSLALLTFIAPPAPFVPSAWVLVRGIDRFDRSWSTNLLQTTLSQPIAPFTSVDWRLPIQAGRSGQVWTQNVLLSTLFVPPVMPLNLFDTRLPVYRVRSALNWVGQPINFAPPPIVSPLNGVNPERELEALEKGRLIITFNGSRLILSSNSRGRLIS
jgi:hypothetical protein